MDWFEREERDVWAHFLFVVVFYSFELQITSFENLMEPMDPLLGKKKCIHTLHNI